MKHYSLLFLIGAIAAAAFAYSGVVTDAKEIGKGLAVLFIMAYLVCLAMRLRNNQRL